MIAHLNSELPGARSRLIVCDSFLKSLKGKINKNPQLVKQSLMMKTFWGTVKQGKIELLESADLVEGTQVLVTLIPNDGSEFWLQASQVSLDQVWDNSEDDIYAELLEE